MDYPITSPSAPGVYESEKLGDRATLVIADSGAASTVVTRADTAYQHPILDLSVWAAEYGPFRRLGEDAPEDPTDPEPETATSPELAEAIVDVLQAVAAKAPQTEEEAA